MISNWKKTFGLHDFTKLIQPCKGLYKVDEKRNLLFNCPKLDMESHWTIFALWSGWK